MPKALTNSSYNIFMMLIKRKEIDTLEGEPLTLIRKEIETHLKENQEDI